MCAVCISLEQNGKWKISKNCCKIQPRNAVIKTGSPITINARARELIKVVVVVVVATVVRVVVLVVKAVVVVVVVVVTITVVGLMQQ